MKPGENLVSINHNELEVGIKVNHLNIKVVQALLGKHYGRNWNEMEKVKWCKHVIKNNQLMPDNPQPESECLNKYSDEGPEVEVNQVILREK